MEIRNYVAGAWTEPAARDQLPVLNPATNQLIARVPVSSAAEVDRAVAAANDAFPQWRLTPPGDRIQPLFRFKHLLEENLEELAHTITDECGKTRDEAVGGRRARPLSRDSPRVRGNGLGAHKRLRAAVGPDGREGLMVGLAHVEGAKRHGPLPMLFTMGFPPVRR